MAIRVALFGLAVVTLFTVTGCASSNEGGADTSDLPQAQPASWEGGLPGISPSGPAR